MFKFIHYYGRFQTARGNLGNLPSWSKPLLLLMALPGLILAGLSIALFAVSIIALLLLTVPAYRLVRLFEGRVKENQPDEPVVSVETPRRHIDVTIVE